MPAHSHHVLLYTRTIQHINKFLHQPAYYVIRFRTACKLHQTYFTNSTCHNLHNYTPERFTFHRTLLHTHYIQHEKEKIVPDFQVRQKILYKTNLSQSTKPHPHTLPKTMYTSLYNRNHVQD